MGEQMSQPYTLLPLVTSRSQTEQSITKRKLKIVHPKKGNGVLGEVEKVGRTLAEGPELFVIKRTPGIGSVLKAGEQAAGVVGNLPQEVGLPGVNAAENLQKDIEAPGNVVKQVESVGEALHTVTSRQTWIRVGKVIAGALVIMFGLYLVLKAISPDAAALPIRAAKAVRP